MQQQMWRDLFNRAASTDGSAIKQIAPHRQRSLAALFFQRPSTPG
jgi:hypothetical protein